MEHSDDHGNFIKEHPIASFFISMNCLVSVLTCACLAFLLFALSKIDTTSTTALLYSKSNQDYLIRNEKDHGDIRRDVNTLMRDGPVGIRKELLEIRLKKNR